MQMENMEDMKLYVVMSDEQGRDANNFDSVWSTKELAEERCKELNKYCSPKNPIAWWHDVELDKA
jgi:hypothetical protein